jgi:hypothetical protein
MLLRWVAVSIQQPIVQEPKGVGVWGELVGWKGVIVLTLCTIHFPISLIPPYSHPTLFPFSQPSLRPISNGPKALHLLLIKWQAET